MPLNSLYITPVPALAHSFMAVLFPQAHAYMTPDATPAGHHAAPRAPARPVASCTSSYAATRALALHELIRMISVAPPVTGSTAATTCEVSPLHDAACAGAATATEPRSRAPPVTAASTREIRRVGFVDFAVFMAKTIGAALATCNPARSNTGGDKCIVEWPIDLAYIRTKAMWVLF